MDQTNWKKIRGYGGNNRGFTLVEIVIGLVLLSIMGVFSIGYLRNLAETTQLTESQKTLVDESKFAMEFLVRELRMADDTTNSITIGGGGTSVTFDKLNAYPKDTNISSVNYTWNSGAKTLTRTSASVTTTLATNVTSFNISVSSDFYTITMTLAGSSGENFTLESAVRPRITI
ncbi:MAG: prepilin-type N-terminal cleavage/methylation domain-containing protein [Nitrospinae bacterium]|nr:prepilin-type N-terminal cleavage/methylation domain-containing protein [Nitrospinota bacterium]